MRLRFLLMSSSRLNINIACGYLLCRQICTEESVPISNDEAALQSASKYSSGAGASRLPLTRIVNQNVAKAALLLAAVDPSLGVLIAGAHGNPTNYINDAVTVSCSDTQTPAF